MVVTFHVKHAVLTEATGRGYRWCVDCTSVRRSDAESDGLPMKSSPYTNGNHGQLWIAATEETDPGTFAPP